MHILLRTHVRGKGCPRMGTSIHPPDPDHTKRACDSAIAAAGAAIRLVQHGGLAPLLDLKAEQMEIACGRCCSVEAWDWACASSPA